MDLRPRKKQKTETASSSIVPKRAEKKKKQSKSKSKQPKPKKVEKAKKPQKQVKGAGKRPSRTLPSSSSSIDLTMAEKKRKREKEDGEDPEGYIEDDHSDNDESLRDESCDSLPASESSSDNESENGSGSGPSLSDDEDENDSSNGNTNSSQMSESVLSSDDYSDEEDDNSDAEDARFGRNSRSSSRNMDGTPPRTPEIFEFEEYTSQSSRDSIHSSNEDYNSDHDDGVDLSYGDEEDYNFIDDNDDEYNDESELSDYAIETEYDDEEDGDAYIELTVQDNFGLGNLRGFSERVSGSDKKMTRDDLKLNMEVNYQDGAVFIELCTVGDNTLKLVELIGKMDDDRLLEAFLQYFAHVNENGFGGWAPIRVAANGDIIENDEEESITGHDIRKMAQLMIDEGVRRNGDTFLNQMIEPYGETLLTLAVRCENDIVLKLLLKQKKIIVVESNPAQPTLPKEKTVLLCDINKPNAKGVTPLMCAGSIEALNNLLEHRDLELTEEIFFAKFKQLECIFEGHVFDNGRGREVRDKRIRVTETQVRMIVSLLSINRCPSFVQNLRESEWFLNEFKVCEEVTRWTKSKKPMFSWYQKFRNYFYRYPEATRHHLQRGHSSRQGATLYALYLLRMDGFITFMDDAVVDAAKASVVKETIKKMKRKFDSSYKDDSSATELKIARMKAMEKSIPFSKLRGVSAKIMRFMGMTSDFRSFFNSLDELNYELKPYACNMAFRCNNPTIPAQLVDQATKYIAFVLNSSNFDLSNDTFYS
jgi:hypothetical protein